MKNSKRLVDPELAPMLDGFGDVTYTRENIQQSRQAMSVANGQNVEDHYAVTVREEYIDSIFEDNKIRIIIISPKETHDGKQPLLFSIHGGGMVMGSPEMDSEFHAFMAQNYNFIGVSVEYRLSPEVIQPALLHDNYSAIKWCVDHAEELNIDKEKIAISGDSAGGGLAGGLALYIMDKGEFEIQLVLLRIPMLDDRTGAKPDHPVNGEFVWNHASNKFGWESALGKPAGSEDVSPYYSPARAESTAKLPPVYMCVGSLGLFADETLDFAKKLMHDGVPVELHVYPGYFHGGIAVTSAYYARQEFDNRLHALLKNLKIEDTGKKHEAVATGFL